MCFTFDKKYLLLTRSLNSWMDYLLVSDSNQLQLGKEDRDSISHYNATNHGCLLVEVRYQRKISSNYFFFIK